jgi:hypothetical protein
MIAFIVETENRPGEIARISEAVAEKGINITTLGSVAWGERGATGLMTSDPDETRDVLDRAGMIYRELDTVEFHVPDKPGTLAEVSRKLANAGVNVELLVPSGMGGGEVTFTAAVDNVPLAQKALGTAILAHA